MKNRFSRLLISAVSAFLALTNARGASAVITDPASTSIGIVTGGDPEEGLDLEGNFIYALSFGADPELSVQVRGATFLGLISNEVPGANLVAELRAAHIREHGEIGMRASHLTEGGYCALFSEGAKLEDSVLFDDVEVGDQAFAAGL